jgi:uncharacterized membrane protein HdeD (DUF308 family)
MSESQKKVKNLSEENADYGSTMLLIFGILGFIISLIMIFDIPLHSITIAIISATLIISSILIRKNNL